MAKEKFQKLDFDTTVRIQDHIPRRFDDNFSIFSIFGSAEITIGICLIMIVLSLVRLRFLSILGWLMIVPASMAEVFGKLILYHPGPPVLFHRTTLATHLPSFYVHTDFSYPSGHMTRTIFIVTVFCSIIFFSKINNLTKFLIIASLLSYGILMGITRIHLGEHWLSDVLGGSVLGISMGFFAAILIISSKTIAKEII